MVASTTTRTGHARPTGTAHEPAAAIAGGRLGNRLLHGLIGRAHGGHRLAGRGCHLGVSPIGISAGAAGLRGRRLAQKRGITSPRRRARHRLRRLFERLDGRAALDAARRLSRRYRQA